MFLDGCEEVSNQNKHVKKRHLDEKISMRFSVTNRRARRRELKKM